jgi:xanthine dehydrogenase accessory factor
VHRCHVGARTPSEKAISILAEVIAVRTGRTGESLRDTSGPIHPHAAVDAGTLCATASS